MEETTSTNNKNDCCQKCYEVLAKGVANRTRNIKVLFRGGRYPRTNPATNPRTSLPDNRRIKTLRGRTFLHCPAHFTPSTDVRISEVEDKYIYKDTSQFLRGFGEFSFISSFTDASLFVFRVSVLSLMI